MCNLSWSREIRHPDLPFSVFEVPAEFVKGGRSEHGRRTVGYVVLNSVAQRLIEAQRGIHPDLVFVYQHNRGRAKSSDVRAVGDRIAKAPRAITGGMLNTGWIGGCKRAELAGLHVHDLRHTVGMRLREVGVPERTIAEVLWHSTGSNVTLITRSRRCASSSMRWNRSAASRSAVATRRSERWRRRLANSKRRSRRR